MVTAVMRIDVTGGGTGTDDVSRDDGLPNALVTLNYVGTGGATFLWRFWDYQGDQTVPTISNDTTSTATFNAAPAVLRRIGFCPLTTAASSATLTAGAASLRWPLNIDFTITVQAAGWGAVVGSQGWTGSVHGPGWSASASRDGWSAETERPGWAAITRRPA